MQRNPNKTSALLLSLVISVLLFASYTRAQEELPPPEIVSNEEISQETVSAEDTASLPESPEPPKPQLPTAQQQLVVTDPAALDETFKPSATLTAALKFLARGSEALAWTLNIKEGGLGSVALQSTYSKVLTIVNSLFVLGILGIAGLFMVRPITRRPNMKRLILVYAAAVIFVNFALPLNRLLIDGSQLLSRTLLYENGQNISITDIVQTPADTGGSLIGYVKQTKTGATEIKDTLQLTLVNPDGNSITLGNTSPTGAVPGLTQGTLSGEGGGDIKLQTFSAPQDISLKANQPIAAELSRTDSFNGNQEQILLATFMLALNGMAYFALAILLVLRLVILWGLLILSPALFLLAVFEITRGYFLNWLSLYGRWLLIGPLSALGLSIVIGLWKNIGIPLQSTFVSKTAEPIFNVGFRLPGSQALNTLSTTSELMQYLTFVLMLYLPVFFALALTHGKAWSAVTTIIERRRESRGTAAPAVSNVNINQTAASANVTATSATLSAGTLVGSFKDLLSSQFGKASAPALSPSLRSSGVNIPTFSPAPTAQSFLPEQLSVTPLPQMLKLMGVQEDSRRSREEVITKLAAPERLADPIERKHATLIRSEIMSRANQGIPEAIVMRSEIQTQSEILRTEKTTVTSNAPASNASAAGTPGPIQVNVRTSNVDQNLKPEDLKPKDLKAKPAEPEEATEEEKTDEEKPSDNPNPDEENQ